MLENIIDKLANKLKKDFRRTAKIKLEYSQTNAGTRFSNDIQILMDDGNLDRIVLLLDEVEFITPNLSGALGKHWDLDFVPFWQTIRAVHQETSGRLVFLVAGVNPAAVEEARFNNLPNPIFQLAVPYFLEPFNRSGVRDMVRTLGKYTGADFNEECYQYLTNTFGGHPFLIRIACSLVWREMNHNDPQQLLKILLKDLQERHVRIRERLAQPIKDILLSLVWWYPEEYELLRCLAHGDQAFVEEYVKESPNSMLRFAQYGLLQQEKTSDFAIEDLRDFLREHGESYKKELSPFTRSDMPPDYLPEIPDLKTLGELFEQRVNIEIKFRQVIVFYLGVHRNWNNMQIAEDIIKGLRKRPDRKDPASLFVGTKPQDVMNELYLPDLKEIITTNWGIFTGLFDGNKSRFEMNMDTVNTIRKSEAHTRDITRSQKRDFDNSCSWLLHHLEKVPNI